MIQQTLYLAYALFQHGYPGKKKSPTYESIELENTSSQSLPVPIIYGKCRIAGNIIYFLSEVAGVLNWAEYNGIRYIVGISEGEINAITEVQMDNEIIVYGPNYKVIPSNINTWYYYKLGKSDQLLSPLIKGKNGKTLNLNDRAKEVGGLRYISLIEIINIRKFSDIFQLPTYIAYVEGKKIKTWDIGTGNWTITESYSNNPICCIRDLLTNSRYSIGLANTKIDNTTFLEALNYCNGQINSENKYELDLVLDKQRPLQDWINIIMPIIGGWCFESEGKIKIKIDKAEDISTTNIYNADNIIANSFEWGKLESDIPNRIIIEYTDTSKPNYVAYAIAEDQANIDIKGIIEQTIQMPGIKRFSHASRLAYLILLSGLRNETYCSFKTGINALLQEPGDIIRINYDLSASEKWDDKTFRIISMEENENDEFEFYCIEYNVEIYTDDLGSLEPETNYTIITDKFISQPPIISDFDIIINHDELSSYPEALQELKDYGSTENPDLAKLVITNIKCPSTNIKEYDIKTIKPIKISGTQITGEGGYIYIENDITYFRIQRDFINEFGSSLKGQIIITFDSDDDSDPTENIILDYWRHSVYLFTTFLLKDITEKIPKTGRYFIISRSDGEI